MIKPKITIHTDIDKSVEVQSNGTHKDIVEVVKNPLSEVYFAVKRAIQSIKENENIADSPPYFKTIAIDTGQFNRLVLTDNTEIETPLPAVFIHFTNIRYLVQQNRIGEGRATLRIRFVTNIVNIQDPDIETTPFELFQKINVAIQDAKDHEEHLNERCQLTFFDMPETVNMLQAYWIDYEVWFREVSAWQYRNWKPVRIVMPPFTNHSDQNSPDRPDHLDHKDFDYDNVSGLDVSEVITEPGL